MAIPAPRVGSAALVTGASSGIGAELARQLGQRGHDLVLVARRGDRLAALAAELPTRRVEIVTGDLAVDAERERVIADIEALGLDIEVGVFSAGFGMGGPFADHERARVVQMVRTNLESTMVMAHAVLPGMLARRRGALLLVASMAGLQPMPGFGAYAATKAGVISFAEMLSHEAGRAGVTVTALAPGGVRTEFSEVAGMLAQEKSVPDGLLMDVDECAAAALAGLEAGDRVVVPKAFVRSLVRFARYAPRSVWLPVCRRLMS